MSVSLKSVSLTNVALGSSSDPYFSNVSLLSHFNGANDSTSLIDVIGNTIYSVNSAALSSTNPIFGNASLSLSGTKYAYIGNDGSLSLRSVDFTVELWFKTTSTASLSPMIFRFNGNAFGPSDLQYGIYISSGTVKVVGYASSVVYTTTLSGTWNDGNWHSLAFVRNGNTFIGFIDGVARGSNVFNIVLNNSSWNTYIGYYNEGGTKSYFDGNIDEVRITKGVARYTSDYAVQTSEFPNN